MDKQRVRACLTGAILLATPLMLAAQSPIVSSGYIAPSQDETGTTDPFPSPLFGEIVAISTRTAMASIPGRLATDRNEFGRVAVFEETEDGWERTATLLGTEEAGGSFGHAIDIEGHKAAIAGAKALYLYERRGSAWVQVAKVVLTSSDASFGANIELEGGLIVASVQVQHDEASPPTRVIHVYEQKGSPTLKRTAIIRPPAGSASGSFGTDLSMDGNLLVVGAPDADNAGSAYIYARLGRHWLQIDRLMASDAVVGDGFGSSVAIHRGVIAVGAPQANLSVPDDDAGPIRGNVYVFRPTLRGWYQSQQLNDPSDDNPIRSLGAEVRLGRGLLAVRVPDTRGQIRGEDRVFVYDWSDRLFQFRQRVERYEGRIPDIDLAGRRLILSRHNSLAFTYYVLGDASIYIFGRNETGE